MKWLILKIMGPFCYRFQSRGAKMGPQFCELPSGKEHGTLNGNWVHNLKSFLYLWLVEEWKRKIGESTIFSGLIEGLLSGSISSFLAP